MQKLAIILCDRHVVKENRHAEGQRQEGHKKVQVGVKVMIAETVQKVASAPNHVPLLTLFPIKNNLRYSSHSLSTAHLFLKVSGPAPLSASSAHQHVDVRPPPFDARLQGAKQDGVDGSADLVANSYLNSACKPTPLLVFPPRPSRTTL